MTAEQLQAARAAHWRQNQSPILTLEDAESWLEQHPLCLYLPRRGQLPAPAPSFVEACIGSAQATPGAAAIEQAQGLLTRLIASGTVVALNLLGAVSEQPDFLAHSQALPYVLCLRADADWKHAPQKSSGHKVSPLVLELWKALDKDGVLSAAEARETLGRELTEAAVLRALCELWQALRISPVFADSGQPPRWELLRVRHRDALATAGGTSQVTALSLLVSMYLQSVYAASSEEIEIFLSPVASRSRVREAVRGLSATRQIHSLSMDAQTYYFLEGGLPEFAEPAAPLAVRAEPLQPAAGVAAPVETPRQPLPAQRKDRAARPMRPASPSGRPPRPAPLPAGAPPPARAEWKGARRPAAQWRPAVKPPATGVGGPGRDRGSRPSRPPGRSFSPKTANERDRGAGRGAGAPRTGTRPDTGGQARPDKRAGGWSGPQKRERPAPWVRPAQGSASPPRPPHAGGRGDSPFRPAQKPRPGPRGGSVGGIAPDRRPDRRPPGGRPPAPAVSRPGAANRPPAAGRPPGRAAVPFRSGAGSSGPGGAGRAPGSSPSSGPGTNRGGSPGRGASFDRPRPGGYAKSGAKSAANSGSGRGGKAVRPPLPPGSRPAKSWPRAGTASGRPSRRPGGKSGKPPGSLGGRKPARKKPGV